MAQIKANILMLDEQISQLKTLYNQCQDSDQSPREVRGDGAVTRALERVDKDYNQVRDAISLLLYNSIRFFENIRTSVVQADEDAAQKLK